MAEVEVNRRDMEAGESPALTSAALGLHYWPTIDGPLGVYHEEAVNLAKSFYYVGFLCLPWLWFINCLYFLPVLRNSRSDPLIRPCTLRFCLCNHVGVVGFESQNLRTKFLFMLLVICCARGHDSVFISRLRVMN